MISGKTHAYFSLLLGMLPRYYDYAMKADDDVYIRQAQLALEPLPRSYLYYGFVMPCNSMYPSIEYMPGMGYLLLWDLSEWITEANIPEVYGYGSEDKMVAKWLKMGNKEVYESTLGSFPTRFDSIKAWLQKFILKSQLNSFPSEISTMTRSSSFAWMSRSPRSSESSST